jgi:hypothetical protein
MHIPCLLEKVCLQRRRGLFLVVWMDYERRIANLMPLLGLRAHMEQHVPFGEI